MSHKGQTARPPAATPSARWRRLRPCSRFASLVNKSLDGPRAWAIPIPYGFGAQEGAASSSTTPAARQRRVIFLYMNGGLSQVDSFDPKPMLERNITASPLPSGEVANRGRQDRHAHEVAVHVQENTARAERR